MSATTTADDLRPTDRTLLPFRVGTDAVRGYPVKVIEFDGLTRVPDGRGGSRLITQPYRRIVEESADGASPDPLGQRLLEMMRIYFDLESGVDALKKSLEETKAENARLLAALEERDKAARGLRDQLERERQQRRGGR